MIDGWCGSGNTRLQRVRARLYRPVGSAGYCKRFINSVTAAIRNCYLRGLSVSAIPGHQLCPLRWAAARFHLVNLCIVYL